ncbi:MAG: hypothetical protein IPO21_19265 [Bacteroidales bacterium]|nr:hypothetical protein [Bacteroidales bacterium]
MAKNKDTKQKDWSIIYSEIADLLAEFYEDNRDSSPQLLYKILSEDSMFIKKQKWFINLKTYKSSGVDPVHVFASFNNGKQRKESKLEIIQDWFSILTGSGIDNDIIFEGGPSPFTVRILSGRNTDDQIEIWEEFYNIYKDKSSVFNSNLDMKVKKWYGLSFTSITIFLFLDRL